jgi:hypothetical protein
MLFEWSPVTKKYYGEMPGFPTMYVDRPSLTPSLGIWSKALKNS